MSRPDGRMHFPAPRRSLQPKVVQQVHLESAKCGAESAEVQSGLPARAVVSARSRRKQARNVAWLSTSKFATLSCFLRSFPVAKVAAYSEDEFGCYVMSWRVSNEANESKLKRCAGDSQHLASASLELRHKQSDYGKTASCVKINQRKLTLIKQNKLLRLNCSSNFLKAQLNTLKKLCQIIDTTHNI